jgi:DNA-binding Lrp family transcriptional regulator
MRTPHHTRTLYARRLDTCDAAILRALQQNGRAPNKQLAQASSLSEPCSLRRLHKLESLGYILGYSVRLSEKATAELADPMPVLQADHERRLARLQSIQSAGATP